MGLSPPVSLQKKSRAKPLPPGSVALSLRFSLRRATLKKMGRRKKQSVAPLQSPPGIGSPLLNFFILLLKKRIDARRPASPPRMKSLVGLTPPASLPPKGKWNEITSGAYAPRFAPPKGSGMKSLVTSGGERRDDNGRRLLFLGFASTNEITTHPSPGGRDRGVEHRGEPQ